MVTVGAGSSAPVTMAVGAPRLLPFSSLGDMLFALVR
jgi:hypothetical protein